MDSRPPDGAALLGALTHHGLDAIGAHEKQAMRALAQRGGPYTHNERRDLLDYCASDVDALARLLPQMAPRLDLGRALLRGRFMNTAAAIEHHAIPMDTALLHRLDHHWPQLQAALIERVDADYRVFDGRTFKEAIWAKWLEDHGIRWPRLDSGALCLDADTFKQMAQTDARIRPMHELRASLSQLRFSDLSVGRDGRNRVLTSAFRARTSRNQPSNTKFIFGRPAWMRRLIRARARYGTAYVDWSQQEWGIAAALSGDAAMMDAYRSGDAYLAYAKQAGAVPSEVTKKTPGVGPIRDQYKETALGTQYGQGVDGIAVRIQRPPAYARELLRMHHRLYRTFWEWSDTAVDHAMLHGHLVTVFGWPIFVGRDANPRSLRNFAMQANGGEMLRLAACLAIERGVIVCALIHDAMLIEASLDRLAEAVAITQEAMREASEIVLRGFSLRTDVKLYPHPECFVDDRGKDMWREVSALLEQIELPPSRIVTSR